MVAEDEAPASTAYTKVPLLELELDELLRDELIKLDETLEAAAERLVKLR